MSRSHEAHLSADALARWVDGTVSADERPSVVAHLADCLTCQEEVVAVTALRQRATPARRMWRVAVPIAAAAGLALLFLVPEPASRTAPSEHRAPTATAASGPLTITPVAGARAAGPMIWSRVDGADRYRVTLFAADGSPLWQETTGDTTLVVAAGRLQPDTRHYWKVEARVGIDRWAASPLAEFIFAPVQPR